MPSPALFTLLTLQLLLTWQHGSHTILTSCVPLEHITDTSWVQKSSWLPSHKPIKCLRATLQKRLSMHLNYTSHLFKQVSNFKSLSYTSPPYTISPEITAFCFTSEQYSSITAPRGELLRHATLVSKTSFTSPTWKYQESTLPEQRDSPQVSGHTRLSQPPFSSFLLLTLAFQTKFSISHQTGNLHQSEEIFNRA